MEGPLTKSPSRDAPFFLTHVTADRRHRRVLLAESEILVGRGVGCQVEIDQLDISRFHCRLRRVPEGTYAVSDAGSLHGTLLNGERVAGETVLQAGDVIGIGEEGRIELTFEPDLPMWDLIDRASIPLPNDVGELLVQYKEVLPSLLSALSSTLELDRVLVMILDAVMKLTHANRGVLQLEEGGMLVTRLLRFADRRELEESPLVTTTIRQVFRTGHHVLVDDARSAPDHASEAAKLGVRSIACFPLRAFEGERYGPELGTGRHRVIGIVYTDARRVAAKASDAAATFPQVICDLAAVHLSNARLYERAVRDGLTGLLNRSSFENQLEEHFALSAKAEQPLSLAMLDLDRFKRINDEHGHPAGDHVLCRTADTLRRVIGERGVPFRYGGEEFTVLLPRCPIEESRDLVEDLRAELARRPVVFERGEEVVAIPVTLSAGVVTFPAKGIALRHELTSAADQMLYKAKRAGRNRVAWWPGFLGSGGARAAGTRAKSLERARGPR